MNKNVQLFDGFLLSIGSAYSLANIETVLGIVILVIQLVWIFAKLGLKIYQAFKGKIALDDVKESVEEAVDDLNDIKEEMTTGGDVENE